VATRIPTHHGDVLILLTTRSFRTFAVGQVRRDAQQDLGGDLNVKYFTVLTAAVEQAKLLVESWGRIYLLNIDTGDCALVECASIQRGPRALAESPKSTARPLSLIQRLNTAKGSRWRASFVPPLASESE
jgi:hypothetical protein